MRIYSIITIGLFLSRFNSLAFDTFYDFKSPPRKNTNPINWRNFEQNHSKRQYFPEPTQHRFYPHGGRGLKSKDNNYTKPKIKISKETKEQKNSRLEKNLRRKKVFKTDYLVNKTY